MRVDAWFAIAAALSSLTWNLAPAREIRKLQPHRSAREAVVELDVTNSDAMEPYRAAVGATIEQYGGRFLVRPAPPN